ncbi:two-component sensor histidine kinase [Devosia sp. UYZn731]|uniref:sensor histidine kinase n=1 Tax=Devosia sp. UYZn731 TaxID=3156345 RepID=UPI003395DF39
MPDLRRASVETMNSELVAADPALVGNDALLASVLAGCGDCIKILDLQGRLQFMSEGGKRVMEVEDFSALKGCPWPDFWAGDGNVAAKQAIESAAAGKRARFVGNANTAKGNPRFWDVEVMPILGTDGKPSHLLSISRDITELTDTQKRHDLLAAELHHRIKNTITMVSAIATQTFKGDDIADRRTTFQARIQALSTAQDVLISKTWQSAPIQTVVESALTPHLSNENRFTIAGEHLELTARQSLSIALAVHELATNAAKYGALSVAGGEVDIHWSTDQVDETGDRIFKFTWKENGGPVVAMPTTKGFGSRLIARVLGADFGGTVDVDYKPAGVVCILRAPAESVVSES